MASWVGARSGATPSQLDKVIRAIRYTPIIDNHAHPLLRPEALSQHPLLSITTEASGDAIHAAPTSLAHLRAIKQLASVLRCDLTWEAVVAAVEQRRIEDPDDWTAQCLDGIETILVDDGLDDEASVQPYSWHDGFTRSECKRIVRIEAVATEIIRRCCQRFDAGSQTAVDDAFVKVIAEFDTYIREAVDDQDVVGFKSVICYRTGLDIPGSPDIMKAKESLASIFGAFETHGEFKRLQHDGLNDLFVHRAAMLIKESGSRQKKPIQFHTGLGDNDITLTRASPSHLQEFIRAYPTVPIVLLHASYPYTREAGYLACVYANVYADIGEVFPFVSRDGQESVIRQILELCPWSKILWSTDGHWFPETYLLAVMQMREAMQTVLCDYVRTGQLGWKAAVELTQAVLFQNSNKLYHLELELDELGDSSGADQNRDRYRSDLELFQDFVKDEEMPDFVRICWNDLTATPRMRMVPIRKFTSLLDDGAPSDIGITRACLGMLQNDTVISGVSATGEYRLHPDFSSLRAGPVKGQASMYGDFREPDGSRMALCPRSLLQRAVDFGAEQGLSFLIGFEIEFLLLERLPRSAPGAIRYATLTNDGHAWSASRYSASPAVSALLSDMAAALARMGIHAEQLHAESAPGQFELVLPPLPPVEAADALLHARDAMAALATAAGFRMSLHPKPFAAACGTAAHAHLSLSSARGARPDVYEAFYAGVLRRLRGLAAFTLAGRASYERVVDGAWAGGRWVAWGTQNRETALRKIAGSHWELKALDGLANPYLAVGAVLLAGTRGVEEREALVWRDCEIDPASLTENDRKELNVTQMLPGSLEEALEALREDEGLVELMGAELVERYVAVKEAELKLLDGMKEDERRQWIMERY